MYITLLQDDETMQVLNQIHDGAIDEIITGLDVELYINLKNM